MKIAPLGHMHMSVEPNSTLQHIHNIVAFTQMAVHSNAIVLVYFVPYLHYLCSVTHTNLNTIKKIWPEEAKCYHDISLEVMRKTCVNESYDSI